ncbi:hypothetical protein ASO12_01550 [Neisseria gonorrhoeae]|nr:hypothetical protein ASO12_01550 [Neisseria gonorrhoeae]
MANTPHEASTDAGFNAIRKLESCVRKPPSSRITAKASWLMKFAITTLLKAMPPTPSSPASMPTARNTSSKGIPKRADKVVETTLRNNSAPPSRNRLFIQSTPTAPP